MKTSSVAFLAALLLALLTRSTFCLAWAEAPETSAKVLEKAKQMEDELRRLNRPPAQPQGEVIRIVPDEMVIAITNLYAEDAIRYFAAHVTFVNPTEHPVEIERKEISIMVDGKVRSVVDVPSSIANYGFQVGNKTQSLSKLNVLKTLKVPAQGMADAWIFCDALDVNQAIPSLQMEIKLPDQKLTMNFTEYTRAQLKPNLELIGPQKCLGLLTISGNLNSLNLKILLEEIDNLLAQQVYRVVIHWAKGAEPPDQSVYQFLAQAAGSAGFRELNNRQFPEIPLAIREMHLASVPGNSSSYSYYNGPRRVHETIEKAVTAALYSAYEIIPPQAVLQEIQQGHELSRIAALTTASGRLPRNQLPLIVKFARSEDPRIQQAALSGLRDFGDPLAIQTLVEFAKNPNAEIARTAISSLASSRFGTSHEALLEMLQSADPGLKKTVVTVLAKYPRPIWSEPIYEFARQLDTPVGREALKALVAIGHPKLDELLQNALNHKDPNLQNEILTLLISRNDPKSEQLALEYTMEKMQNNTPTSAMLGLIRKTKHQKAVPLLLKHFEKENNRGEIINTLAEIGDQSVTQALVKAYPSLKNYEQPTVLGALMRLKAPEFRPLAKEALYSDNYSLVSIACQGLRLESNPETVKWLHEALDQTKHPSGWSEIANALAAIATEEAREALRQTAVNAEEQKRNTIIGALQNLYQRSPGYRYVYQGRDYSNRQQDEDALQFYDMALKIDPRLPDALEGRGHVYLKLKKPKEALSDYRKAAELDPFSSISITGVGLAMIMLGDVQKGIEFGESGRKEFGNDSVYAYNMACIYSRALEQVREQKDQPEREKLLEDYRKTALKELARSRELGFNQVELMKDDPDLNALRDEPEFQKLISEEYQPAEREKPKL